MALGRLQWNCAVLRRLLFVFGIDGSVVWPAAEAEAAAAGLGYVLIASKSRRPKAFTSMRRDRGAAHRRVYGARYR